MLLFESFNASAAVDKLLLTGIERMAFGAYINLYIALCGLSNIFLAASASDDGILVFRMYALFHIYLSLTFSPIQYIIKKYRLQYLFSLFYCVSARYSV